MIDDLREEPVDEIPDEAWGEVTALQQGTKTALWLAFGSAVLPILFPVAWGFLIWAVWKRRQVKLSIPALNNSATAQVERVRGRAAEGLEAWRTASRYLMLAVVANALLLATVVAFAILRSP